MNDVFSVVLGMLIRKLQDNSFKSAPYMLSREVFLILKLFSNPQSENIFCVAGEIGPVDDVVEKLKKFEGEKKL